MKTIYAKWDTGSLTLDLEQFFSTSPARVKKLVKILRLDWQDGENTLEYVRAYLETQAAEVRSKLSGAMPKYRAVFYDPKQVKEIGKAKQWPDGTPLQQQEKAHIKALVKWYQQIAAIK